MSSALSEHLLGILCAHKGRYYVAEQAFLNAVEAEPEMVGSYIELGLVYACRGEYGEMVEALRRAVDIGSGGVRAYLGQRPLGDVTAGRVPATHEHAAAEGESGRVHSLLTSAMLCLSEGRDEEAAMMLERAPEGKPDSPPAVMALLALAYLLRGERVVGNDAGIRRG
jgi:tetratricopeptide (TPR) repeat protein